MSTPPFELGTRDGNPQITDPRSPLVTLTERALRQMGDFAPISADGELMLMFIDFGNEIVDDVRGHAYWPLDRRLDYYVHPTDRREIPDMIVQTGLSMRYAMQQASDKVRLYQPKYYQQLNGLLWQAMNSNRAIQHHVVDDGSNPRYQNGRVTNQINGQSQIRMRPMR